MRSYSIEYHPLIFKKPAGTSRGVLSEKPSYFLRLSDSRSPQMQGVGECSLIPGLSLDDETKVEEALNIAAQQWCEHNYNSNDWLSWPAVRFAIEMAELNLNVGVENEWFPSAFTQGKTGIPINGLIWMGSQGDMLKQTEEKLNQGFSCIKMKVGAIDFEEELEVLKQLRNHFSAKELVLRVDANGAFEAKNALEYLKPLADLELHSIEQPIQPKQRDEMRKLCEVSPLAIALDEELIGVHTIEDQNQLLEEIKPQYIIIKPSLLGGFKASEQWVNLAQNKGIDWWATSALESNIGLKAIAEWTYKMQAKSYQGLGTGALYTNNIPSSLAIRKGMLFAK